MASSKNITEITILNLLNERPMYGAEMVEEIKRLSGNTVIMSLPTLYSSLHRMATKKLVNSYQKQSTIGGRCRVYNITKVGREYLNKNQIKIDYSLITNNTATINNIESSQINTDNTISSESTTPRTTYTTLEDAFSLPLSKPNTTLTKNDSAQNADNITSYTEQLQNTENVSTSEVKSEHILVEEPTPKPKKKAKPDILPYISPNEKITTTPEPQYQQTLIGLSGTTGGSDLRPLLELNDVTVGNDYVMINRLRIVSVLINTVIFMLINFVCSLFHTAQSEYYKLIYIVLFLYTLINLAIYIVYPRIKAFFNIKACASHHVIVTIILFALVLVCCFITSAWNLLWLAIFSLVPLIEFILMSLLRKRSWFLC